MQYSVCDPIISAIIIDVDECMDDNGGCDHMCHSSPGSFYCKCSPGYTLMDDGHTCAGNTVVTSVYCT